MEPGEDKHSLQQAVGINLIATDQEDEATSFSTAVQLSWISEPLPTLYS